MPKYVDGTKLYEEALKRIAELEAEFALIAERYKAEYRIVAKIWEQLGLPSYEDLKGRSIHDLIDEIIAERDQLAAGLKDAHQTIGGFAEVIHQQAASLGTARKALTDGLLQIEYLEQKFKAETGTGECVKERIRQALAQIANPPAQKDEECTTCDTSGRCTYVCEQQMTKPIEQLRTELKAEDAALEERKALPQFEDVLVQKIYSILVDMEQPPDGEHWEGFTARKIAAALEERDRAVAKRIINSAMEADDFDAWLDTVSREFGLEE